MFKYAKIAKNSAMWQRMVGALFLSTSKAKKICSNTLGIESKHLRAYSVLSSLPR